MSAEGRDASTEPAADLLVERPNLRKTHPNLWRSVVGFAIVNIALGLNFIFLQPTFLIYSSSNYIWGAIFLALGIGKLTFLRMHRLRLVRVTMGLEVGYMLFLVPGTVQPYLEAKGSLQLPILYLALAALELPLMLEPYINPFTARRQR